LILPAANVSWQINQLLRWLPAVKPEFVSKELLGALANRQKAFSLKPKSDCPLPGNEKPGAISSDKTIRTDCAPGWQSARRKKQHFFESYRDE
jgi:hypothetical protein